MRLILSMSALCFSFLAHAQLFKPQDVQRAFDKNTRSADGKPGKNYWQNHADYTIDVSVAPPNRTVTGTETIVYYNESPDTLRYANIKLFINIHKAGASRDGDAGQDYLTNGMIITAATADGVALKLPPTDAQGTNMSIRFPTPLSPKKAVTLKFSWNYDVSVQSGREGAIDSTTYFLAYFYPRVAVYDDYNGWDRMPFVDSHEFYSDFNNYTVNLNVPANFLVTGTGMLQNPETVLLPEVLQKYKAAQTSDKTVNIVTPQELRANKVTTQNATNTFTFTANDIPDVAFAISNHYNWDGSSVEVDDASGRRATAYAMYDDKAADYHFVAKQAGHALNWFSHNWPGVAYPYEKTTVVQGFAGMEYPMMANDESYEDTTFSRFVAEHEIAHTYMPFYMGINETRYGFMDEGWATTFENLIATSDMGAAQATEFYKQFRVQGWISNMNSAGQVPIITPGDIISGPASGNNQYGKASLGYLAMKDMLGDELFKKCLQGYMGLWHGKHPLPWDFFYSFNTIAGKNLDWFWNAWYFDNSYIDIELISAKKTTGGYLLNMKNAGGMPAPVDVIATFADGSTQSFHQSPAVWQSNLQQAMVKLATVKEIVSLKTTGGIFMDATPANNTLQLNK